jgi:hypothetical protein
MHVKKFNYTSFNTIERTANELLSKNSSSAAQQHPEYGIRPYNSQCYECVELIDKRTIDSRLFIDPENEGHTFSQQSYFPLHYKKSENDIWRTIDSRLRMQSPGVYAANDQPVPTKCDLNKKSTSLTEKGFEFEFNKNLSLYFFDDNSLYTQKQAGNYNNYTIGEEGLNVKNIWPGIEMEQMFKVGEIKTNFIIAAPLQIPVNKGWMVIEDHFTLPPDISIVENNGFHLEKGYYQGDYLIKNSSGETLITYEKPVYIDANVLGMHGVYNLIRDGNDYTLQTLIPVEWLKKPDNTYPLMIDPTVYGAVKMGDFVLTGQPAANMAFTSSNLGSCQYHLNCFVPGKSRLTNAYVDMEYTLTYDNTCGSPPLPPPFCTFNMVTMEVVCDSCNTTTGPLSCNPAQPPYTGTCTTDSNLVPGANAILVNSFTPNFLSCIAPQCPDYILPFTLHNRDQACGDVCGYLCARGNMWRMTVEAYRVEGTLSQDKTQICPGQPVTFTGHGQGGVAPYIYAYTLDGGNTWDTATSSSWYIFPSHDVPVDCEITDACGEKWLTNSLYVTVLAGSTPTITVHNDTLIATNADHYQWLLNGNILPGDTFQTLVTSMPGHYQVATSNASGCGGISAVANYLISSINEVAGTGSFRIIPNPSDGNFQLRFTGVSANAPVALRIFDVSGKLIDSRTLQPATGANSYNYEPGKKLVTGVYLLQAEVNGRQFREKLLIAE